MGSNASELIRFLAKARDELISLAVSLTPAELNLATENPGWTVYDTLAHIASSEAGLLATAKRILSGEGSPRPGFDLDAYNQHQVEKRRGRSVGELLAELESSRKEVLSLLETISDEQLALEGKFSSGLPTNVLGVFRRIGEHEQLHCAQIRRAIGKG